MTTGILVLAAGRSRRFGSDKRLARLAEGQTLIETLLDQLETSQLPLLFCLSPGDSDIAALLDARGCPRYFCQRSAEGMGGTLAEGITQVPDWHGVLVALADMPWVAGATYRSVANCLEPEVISVPTYAGKRGHPVGFGQAFYRELSTLGGDAGGRTLLAAHRDTVREIPVNDLAILQDIDVPADIRPAPCKPGLS